MRINQITVSDSRVTLGVDMNVSELQDLESRGYKFEARRPTSNKASGENPAKIVFVDGEGVVYDTVSLMCEDTDICGKEFSIDAGQDCISCIESGVIDTLRAFLLYLRANKRGA
jgi:hypothetical protein